MGARMPFGLDRQTLRIAPRTGCSAPPLWIESVEAALLGRAQTERTGDGLRLTMFGRREVVDRRISAALASALGEEAGALIEVRTEVSV
jgi:hypothetical protein